eukprot:4444726-Lingulodinium_polyedra.AAC.1
MVAHAKPAVRLLALGAHEAERCPNNACLGTSYRSTAASGCGAPHLVIDRGPLVVHQDTGLRTRGFGPEMATER